MYTRQKLCRHYWSAGKRPDSKCLIIQHARMMRGKEVVVKAIPANIVTKAFPVMATMDQLLLAAGGGLHTRRRRTLCGLSPKQHWPERQQLDFAGVVKKKQVVVVVVVVVVCSLRSSLQW